MSEDLSLISNIFLLSGQDKYLFFLKAIAVPVISCIVSCENSILLNDGDGWGINLFISSLLKSNTSSSKVAVKIERN